MKTINFRTDSTLLATAIESIATQLGALSHGVSRDDDTYLCTLQFDSRRVFELFEMDLTKLAIAARDKARA
jgi:hypothetical protein